MSALLALALASAMGQVPATVVRAIDGDTIVVSVGASTEHVRLLGIDAPEVAHGAIKRQPLSSKAKAALIKDLAGGAVMLTADAGSPDIDKYGRSLRWVSAAGKTEPVEFDLLRRGLARAYYFKDLALWPGKPCALEADARARRVGLWGLKHNPKPSQCGGSEERR